MKARIAQIVLALAEYYDKTLSQTQIAMYVEDLSGLDPEDLALAVKKYRQDPKNVFFPLPAKLIDIVNPHMSDLDDSVEVASRILAAVSKFGHNNRETAKAYIGSLGWECVDRIGGWQHLCESLNSGNEGMFRAQFRELAQTVKRKAVRGELHSAPELPQSNEVQKIIKNSVIKMVGNQ